MFGFKRKYKQVKDTCNYCHKHVDNSEYNVYDASLKKIVNFCDDKCRTKFYKNK